MILFALDLGNKQTKIKSSKKVKVLPSRFVEASKYGNRKLLGFAKGEKSVRDFISSKDPNFTYVWGTELDEDMVKPIDTIGFGAARYSSREFNLLVDFALAELAVDFIEAERGVLEVAVVTGVPSSDYSQEPVLDAFQKTLKGDHKVNVDGRNLIIRVSKLFILPQPIGTVINEITNEKGGLLDTTLLSANIGVVDVGGGTLLIDALQKMNMVSGNRDQVEEGAFTLYKACVNELNENGYRVNEYEIESVIREGNDREKYYWSPDGFRKINITDVVMRQREIFTRNIASYIKSTYKDFERMLCILITGGGSNLLVEETFHNELKKEQYVDDSEIATVTGFFKYGLMEGVAN